MPNPGKNRKNALQVRVDRRRRVAELYLRGLSQVEIAGQLGCSQPTVSNDLTSLRDEWLALAVMDFNERKAKELAKLDALERTAWEAWDRSCKDAETCHERTEAALMASAKEKTEAKEQARLVIVKRIIDKTTKGQAGDPRFLERVAWCIEMRLKVVGLLKNVPVNVNQSAFNWDIFAAGMPQGEVPDEIEAELAGLLTDGPAGEGDGTNGQAPPPSANGNGVHE
jgi:predicted transcriptional regulator